MIPLITGVGLATPLGASLSDTWSALCEGKYISEHAAVPGFAGSKRLETLALHVATEALEGAGLSAPSSDADDATALIFGTSKGPATDWLDPPACAMSDHFGLSAPASYVARRLRLFGPRLTLSTACASGLHALIRGALMVQSGEVSRALVVAAEASVHPLFLGSFQRLGVLVSDRDGCRPFDVNRSGFLMSEAAAAVVIEGINPAGPITARIAQNAVARIEGFAMGADATHLTGGHPDAPVLRRLLARLIDGRPVDLVHAHGTGTITNDSVELAAIESVLNELGSPPHLYSHKGALGHSLGAAGLVSVVLNCISHCEGVVLPNVRTTSPLPARRLLLSQISRHLPIHRSLAIAAGFGGAIAGVSLVSLTDA